MVQKKIIYSIAIMAFLLTSSQEAFGAIDITQDLGILNQQTTLNGTYDPMRDAPSCPAILNQSMIYPSAQVEFLCESAVHLCMITNMILQMIHVSKGNPTLLPKDQNITKLNKDLAMARDLSGFYLRGCQLAINYVNQGYTDQGRSAQPGLQ